MLTRSACAIAALLLLSTESMANNSCLTRSEAKAAYKGAYLNWHKNANGKRCWTTRKKKHQAPRIETPAPLPPKPPAQNVIPYQLLFPPMGPLPFPVEALRQQSISDFSPWIWTSEAYAGAPEESPPPIVNRELKSDKKSRYTWNADSFMALVTIWLIVMFIGSYMYKWARQKQLRIER